MRIPNATYRIQFNLNFRFTDAEALVPYLHELGISDLYASPRFKARKGSSHGYDVADPAQINSELGTEEEFNRLVHRLHQYGMGLLLDIVPNHMAASEENPWWMDVLENGRGSRYAGFFDIDWRPLRPKLETLTENRITVPILDAPYAEVLQRQGIRLRLDNRGFFVQYEDHRLPVDPRTYRLILAPAIDALRNSNVRAMEKLELVADLSAALATASELVTPETAAEGAPSVAGAAPPFHAEALSPAVRASALNQREKLCSEIKNALWCVYHEGKSEHAALDDTVRNLNGSPEHPSSFERLDDILRRQPYRLAWWRLAANEINYRRFFDINDLIGLRVEDPAVFAARHASTMHLMQQGKISGLRIDHIDGLLDPLEYLQRVASIPIPGAADEAAPRFFTVVEKILCGPEALPSEWPVHGTTGYDFLNALNSVFVSANGYAQLESIYERFSRTAGSFAETGYLRKKQAITELFRTDLSLLVYLLGRVAAIFPQGRDLSIAELECGIIEITASLPVYRTYFRGCELREGDRVFLEQALAAARRRTPLALLGAVAFDFLSRVFLLDLPLADEAAQEAWLGFIRRWQQFSGSVMAKGLEDTTLFAHPALLSINEVGANPFHHEIPSSAAYFHEFNQQRLERYPHSLSATSTHDTKWSEDFRARLNVLCEIPRQWRAHLLKWSQLNREKKEEWKGKLAPTPNEEILLYQAMLGIWPLSEYGDSKDELKMRLERFLIKAAREAKTETDWISPNEPHEAALRHFVSALFDSAADSAFMADFTIFQQRIAFYGAWNACAQLILKIVSPGVPDFYQGSELWNFRVTDPDNREPVDFRSRTAALEALKSAGSSSPEPCGELLRNWRDGRLKLYATMRALEFRRSHETLFSSGGYVPLSVRGSHRESICAFVRCAGKDAAIAVVPRLLAGFVMPETLPIGRDVWGRTAIVLPSGTGKSWKNIFSGEIVKASRAHGKALLSLASVFKDLPFAILAAAAQ